MLSRLSSVKNLNTKIVAFSSIIQIGDSSIVHALSRALAVQREEEMEYGNEGNFDVYPVFNEVIPFLPLSENVKMFRHNTRPVIQVSQLDVTGVSASSIIHIGSTCHIDLETRLKHIRQLKEGKKKEQ